MSYVGTGIWDNFSGLDAILFIISIRDKRYRRTGGEGFYFLPQ